MSAPYSTGEYIHDGPIEGTIHSIIEVGDNVYEVTLEDQNYILYANEDGDHEWELDEVESFDSWTNEPAQSISSGPDFGMFTDAGNLAVKDAFEAALRSEAFGAAKRRFDEKGYDESYQFLEPVVEQILNAVSKSHSEVNDTAVREVLWSRLEDAAKADDRLTSKAQKMSYTDGYKDGFRDAASITNDDLVRDCSNYIAWMEANTDDEGEFYESELDANAGARIQEIADKFNKSKDEVIDQIAGLSWGDAWMQYTSSKTADRKTASEYANYGWVITDVRADGDDYRNKGLSPATTEKKEVAGPRDIDPAVEAALKAKKIGVAFVMYDDDGYAMAKGRHTYDENTGYSGDVLSDYGAAMWGCTYVRFSNGDGIG